MIAATSMLRPPPARIGKISENIVLPRTIELKKALAGLFGALAGVFTWFFPLGLILGYDVSGLLMSCILMAAVGVFVVSWSPLRGESLSKWMGLRASSARSDRVRIEGRKVRAYIGVAPLPFSAAGQAQIMAGAVDILPGTHDDRGVPLPAFERRRAMMESAGVVPLPSAEEERPAGRRRSSREAAQMEQPRQHSGAPMPGDAGSSYQAPAWQTHDVPRGPQGPTWPPAH